MFQAMNWLCCLEDNHIPCNGNSTSNALEQEIQDIRREVKALWERVGDSPAPNQTALLLAGLVSQMQRQDAKLEEMRQALEVALKVDSRYCPAQAILPIDADKASSPLARHIDVQKVNVQRGIEPKTPETHVCLEVADHDSCQSKTGFDRGTVGCKNEHSESRQTHGLHAMGTSQQQSCVIEASHATVWHGDISLHGMASRVCSLFTSRPGENAAVIELAAGEDPFDVKAAKFVFRLPNSVYGQSMIVPLLVEISSMREWTHWAGMAYICLIINYIAQGGLVSILYHLRTWGATQIEGANAKGVGAEDDGCWKLITALYTICVWVHISYCLKDMKETLDMVEWLHLVPTLTGRSQMFRYVKDASTHRIYLKGGGLSQRRKATLFTCVVLPKFLIAAFLLVLGSLWLATSPSNEELLLNSVALHFIMDVDEVVLGSLAPKRVLRLLEVAPPFELEHVGGVIGRCWTVGQEYSTLLCFCLSAVTLIALERTSVFCTVNWDGWSPLGLG